MTLPELYLLAQDLSVLKSMRLTDLLIKGKYAKHNFSRGSVVFPTSFQSCKSLFPNLISVGRWGHNLIFGFSTCTIVFRMAYKTSLVVSRPMLPPMADDSDVSLRFDTTIASDTRVCLFFKDPLRSGSITVYPIGEVPSEFSYLGLDVLDTAFTCDYMMHELFRETQECPLHTIKNFIMDRRTIAWLDNEVACEALFIAGLNPFCTLEEFDPGMMPFLVKAIKIVYHRAINHLRNDYQLETKVPVDSVYTIYKREGHPCALCDSKISKVSIGGLNTYFCPKCQSVNLPKARPVLW